MVGRYVKSLSAFILTGSTVFMMALRTDVQRTGQEPSQEASSSWGSVRDDLNFPDDPKVEVQVMHQFGGKYS